MSRTIDVIVIGSGMAGLCAATAAARKNARVRIISEGMGCMAISGGAIDLLGYDNEGNLLDNPWAGLKTLAPDHPYTLLGAENIKTALDGVVEIAGRHGLKLKHAGDDQNPRNFRFPTIMGTLRPTYLYQDNIDEQTLANAERVLVVSVKGFRDCRPALVINQLRRYKGWADKEYVPLVLPSPFDEKGRSLSALDLAHVADRPQGRDWMLNAIRGIGKGFDLVLMPPMLGARPLSPVRDKAAETAGCPCLEMASVPPGVAGLRIREALVDELHDLGVEFYENTQIKKAEIKDGNCASLTASAAGREIVHHARAVVVATGGILSGGVILDPGKAREGIFNLDIPVPGNVDDWSEPEIFGKHMVTSLGVKVDSQMRALDKNGVPCLGNVFFAGRTLGGYDYAAEKSGHGVAAATGWQAGSMAAGLALGKTAEQKASGADI